MSQVLGQMQEFGGNSGSREATRDKFMSVLPVMYVNQYAVPPVLGVVILKYQAKPDNLFRENPAPVWCFLAATCVYWPTVGVVTQMTTVEGKCFSFQTLSNAALASGVLSAVSLLSMLLPHPVSLVPLMLWVPLPVVLSWPIFKYAYGLLERGITSVINKEHAIKVEATGSNLPGNEMSC